MRRQSYSVEDFKAAKLLFIGKERYFFLTLTIPPQIYNCQPKMDTIGFISFA